MRPRHYRLDYFRQDSDFNRISILYPLHQLDLGTSLSSFFLSCKEKEEKEEGGMEKWAVPLSPVLKTRAFEMFEG